MDIVDVINIAHNKTYDFIGLHHIKQPAAICLINPLRF
jgi:hypothetical protein